MSLGMNISLDERPKCTLIHLAGRLDARTTPQVEKEILSLLEKGKIRLLVDFSKTNYVSSAGLRLLLSATKKIKARGGRLLFCAITDDVMEIIKMAGFDKILEIYPTESEAIKSL